MRLVNGTAAETIPATDRGFAYGDGVFRTLRARCGFAAVTRARVIALERALAAEDVALA